MSIFSKKIIYQVLFCLIVICLLPQNVVAQAESLVSQTEVSRWIKQLDSNKRAERRTAQASLLKAGPAILSLLPAPELIQHNSVRETVRQIRIQLEHAKAKQSVAGSKVSITGKQTLKAVIAAMTKQTKNKIDDSQLTPAILAKQKEVHFKETPFRKAIDALESIYFIQAEAELLNQKLVLRPRQTSGKIVKQMTHDTGPFRVTIHSAQRRKLFGDDTNHLLRATFQIVVEPRLRPLFMTLHNKEIAATANQQTLKHYNPDARIELALGEGGKNLQFSVDYLIPKKQVIKKVAFAGKANMLIAAGEEAITFTNLLKTTGVSRRRGGVTVRINNVDFIEKKKKSHAAKFKIAVSYDTGGPAFESHRTWIFHNLVYLKGSTGKRIHRNAKFGTTLQKDGAIAVEYNFDHLTESISKYKFVYVAPTLLINVPVTFKFTNVDVLPIKP
ncbi:hypothetical protein MNBD_PLANCTO02-2770 [hydrothermal vent metagenome]|uniref:Uncharacterized protein n=1 Tax=hydrothermal vent metagenome TaxID=652676 RepID=A0A3B1DV64_9ZZZZ